MKKISFNNLSISGKIFFVHFVIVVPVFLALGAWQIRIMKKNLKKETIERFLKDARIAMDFIDCTIYDAAISVQSFTESPVFKKNYSPSEITARMKTWKNRYGYDSISYFDSRRIRLADTGDIGLGKKHPLEGFWHEVLAGNLSSGSDSRIGPVRKIPTLFFASPIKSSGKVTGAGVARCNFDKFDHIIKSIKDDRIHVNLIDRKGRIIYSTYSQWEKKRMTGEAGKLLSMKEALKGGEGSVSEYHRHDKKKYLSVYVQENGFSDFAGNGWKMILSIEKAELYKPLRKTAGNMLIIFLAGLTLLIMAEYYVSRLITKPVKKLMVTIRSIAAGNLEERAETGSGDEIGFLAFSFNKMADKLRDIIISKEKLSGELKKSNEHLAAESQQLEVMNEELKASEEELLVTNEDIKAKQENLETLYGQLQAVNKELARFNKLAVDRELKMAELKKKIKRLETKLKKIQKQEGGGNDAG